MGALLISILLIPNVLAQTTVEISSQDIVPVEIETPHTERTLNEYTPEELVEHFAAMYSVDAALAKEIIRCESGWNRFADNPNSTAYSYFQFIDSTWRWTMVGMGLPESTPKDDYIIAIQAGVWLMSREGTRPWLASISCWGV